MNILPRTPTFTKLDSPAAPASPGIATSHHSHWGTGGFSEFPSIEYRNDIPIDVGINPDQMSSGRRKLGMIVYLIIEQKFYQLTPRKSNGDLVSYAEWLIATEPQKLVWLNPMAQVFDANFEPFYGTGNPDDCWTELCLSCGNLEIVDVSTNKMFTTEDANKIFHFHTSSGSNLTATVHTSCAAGFNLAVNNVGTGFLSLPGALGVSTVLDAQHSGAFMYKSASAVYAVGRL